MGHLLKLSKVKKIRDTRNCVSGVLLLSLVVYYNF